MTRRYKWTYYRFLFVETRNGFGVYDSKWKLEGKR